MFLEKDVRVSPFKTVFCFCFDNCFKVLQEDFRETE